MRPTRTLDRSVLVITGPPGAGKTTVGNALVAELDRAVLLDGDSFFQSIRTGWIPPWERASHAQNRTVTLAIGTAAEQFAAGGYSVVVDGIIGPWLLAEFRSVVRAAVHYVVLRPTAETAMRRATERGEPWLVDPEPISKMYKAFSVLGDHEAHVLETTDEDVSVTVRKLLACLDEGRLLLDPLRGLPST